MAETSYENDPDLRRVVDHCRERFDFESVAVEESPFFTTVVLQFTGEKHMEVVEQARNCCTHLFGLDIVDAFDGQVSNGVNPEYPEEKGYMAEVRISKPESSDRKSP